MVRDFSLHYLTTNSSVKEKIEIIRNWVENYGKIWGRRVIYELVSNQLVKDTGWNCTTKTYKLFQNLRENDLIPYEWFKDKRTDVINVGINDNYSFQERFDLLCKYYTRSSKSLQNFYIEVWSEKELPEITQEILKKYDIGLVMGEGFIGDIPFYNAINRIKEISDIIPTCIFYISDFDCEGEHTFHICKNKLKSIKNVMVNKLFLNKEQIEKYNFISNIGYEERIKKMTDKQKKAHLTKQYVKDFFNKNGLVQYEFDQFPVNLLNEILENTISSYINLDMINKTNEICQAEVKEWLSKHYNEGE